VPIASEYSGTVTLTTTFAALGNTPVTAVFIPSPSVATAYTGATASIIELGPDSGQLAGSVPMSITIPPTGSLSVTVVNTPVPLALNSAGTQATGTLGNVTVTDMRNSYPGWSVSGQEANFTTSGTAAEATIAGDQLGWAPAAVGTLGTGVTLGPAIAPGTNIGGLGDTGGVLFSAAPGSGFGTNVANAEMTLDIPAEQVPGAYVGSLTITYLEAGP
jgi:hypothetical protein